MRASFDPRAFAEKHHLVAELLPFSHRRINALEVMREVDEWLADRPPYQATATPRDMTSVEMQKTSHRLLRTMLLLRGGWAIKAPRSGYTSRWALPSYEHLYEADNLQCAEERTRHARDCARLGVVTDADIAARYDCSRRTIQRETEQPWSDARQSGRTRLIRTLKTIQAWTDTPMATLANRIGQTRQWAWTATTRYAPDWEPPTRPSTTADE